MDIFPLAGIIFIGFFAVICLFEFILKWRWFKYLIVTLALIASGVIFFFSFYGAGLSQTKIAISLFLATLAAYIFSLLLSLIHLFVRRGSKPKKATKA
ncbi:hypothetical protein [Listeria grayi]|uniref:YesK-like protein n=1 Tax=Listeria grayi DSM 20601 TaxID=525367 RepID=D7V088_LISGR|nr:hypothetical protein [Listeria grayi]EFI83841.1 hypothetical protein HMPREF0556_12526 [Listeria grayi DSM 20601]